MTRFAGMQRKIEGGTPSWFAAARTPVSRLPVEFTKKGTPWFRDLASVWHEEDSPPSCLSADSNGLLRRGVRAKEDKCRKNDCSLIGSTALGALPRAKEHMEHAAHDFGGHRVEAIEATNRAIQQLELCLKFDKD
jgi:hypothetical protein